MAHAFFFIYFLNRIYLAPRSLSLSVHALRCKYRVHTHDLPIFDGDISLAAACVCALGWGVGEESRGGGTLFVGRWVLSAEERMLVATRRAGVWTGQVVATVCG